MAEVMEFTSRMKKSAMGKTCFFVELTLDDGEVITKTVDLESYIKIIDGSKREDDNLTFISNELPRFHYYSETTGRPDSFRVMLVVPAGRRIWQSYSYDYCNDIPYPALIFALEYRKGQLTRKRCFALDTDTPDDDSRLYVYPYGHVSAGGSICMGSCPTKVENFSHADEFVDSFLFGDNAGHWYSPSEMSKRKLSLRDLVVEVSKKDKFPKTWLCTAKSEIKTVGELKKALSKGNL